MTSDRPAWVGPGILLVLLTAIVSGVSTFVNAYAVPGTGSDAFVTVRNLVVAGAFLPVALVATRYQRAPALRGVDWMRLVAIGLVGGAIPFLLFFHGLALATAAGGATTASFGYRTLFLMASVLGIVVLRERFHGRLLLGATLLLVGNALLLSLTAPIWTDGTGYVLIATALWAVEYTISKRALADLPSATVALGRMGFGAVFLSGYLAVTLQWGAVARFSGADWSWIGVSAALLVAFVASFYTGLKRVDLSAATALLVLGFPITWLLGVLFQGQPIGLGAAVGALLAVGGVAAFVGLAQLRTGWAYLAGVLRPSAHAT